ncbi:class I SAM-dependent DNA methyltransferase [Maritimibacter dapengensis]|uniref:Class I SAM-dependent methyltransferase n=1 Tax=Maritimibacter dapengensis TaxID=2836868 RepID=A0ABS6T678_9RHOB|nr:class I SAM-dependent methyltransferase [Maritimibacter dapengensis]MBV7380460.1 class I SAM-dependent methyltransferase [Maritimibacter dapengensis]
MSVDAETLAVYDARSAEYACMVSAWDAPGLDRFIASLPQDAHVLDLGCGPGLDARRMMEEGVSVDAVDASTAMVAAAREIGVPARRAPFDDVDGTDIYDGIWANFSLLHAHRADFPRHLASLCAALKTGGLLHLGMKLGEGESRDALGRFYTYYGEDELLTYLTDAGLTVLHQVRGQGKGLSGEASSWLWVQARG